MTWRDRYGRYDGTNATTSITSTQTKLESTHRPPSSVDLAIAKSEVSLLIADLNKRNEQDTLRLLYELISSHGGELYIHFLRCLILRTCGPSQPSAVQSQPTQVSPPPPPAAAAAAAANAASATFAPAQPTLQHLEPSQEAKLSLAVAVGGGDLSTSSALLSEQLSALACKHHLSQILLEVFDEASARDSAQFGIYRLAEVDLTALASKCTHGYWQLLSFATSLRNAKHIRLSTQASLLIGALLPRLEHELGAAAPDNDPELLRVIEDLLSVSSQQRAGVGRDELHPRSRELLLAYIQPLRKMSLAHLFENVGSRCTASVDTLTQILANEGFDPNSPTKPLNPLAVAQGILYITISAPTSAGWNPEVLAKAICRINSHLSWADVVTHIVEACPVFSSEEALCFMAQACYTGCARTGETFPSWKFFERWGDDRSQVEFLRRFIAASQVHDIFQDTRRPVIPPYTLDAVYHYYKPLLQPILTSIWNSQTLIISLLRLSNTSVTDEVSRLIALGEQAEPILLPLSLISTKSGFPALHNLFYQATNHFLRNKSPKSNLYFELFRILDKKALLDALYYIYRQDRDSISHSLDVLVDLNMFRDTVLIPRREEIEFLDFILELAILADRREYLVFESWYGTVLAEFGNEMLHHSLDILNSKVLLERERQQGEIPKGVRFSLDEFEVMFSTLSKVKMSPNNTENFKSIYRFFKELLPDLTAAREKDNAVTSAQVEEKADRLFLDLYKNKISFKTMVETLAHYRDSAERELRNTAKHVIQYPIEEFKFFANYPERELGITGRLVGQAIKQHFYSLESEGLALRMVIDALKSPPDSKVFTFGVIAVEEFCNRVEEWPSFCIALYKIPHLHNTSYKSFELIRNIVSLSAKSIQGGSDSAGSAASVQSAPQDLARPSGGADTTHKRPFTSLDPSPPPSAPGVEFSDPSEDVQDKIQFAVNNLAQSNLEEKLAEVKESLKESYYVWFSQTVLVKRASQEPNYHALYLKFLDLLNSSLLTRCILHDTYLNIQRLLNAKTTISSSQDRLQLKNLGSWLGGLTLARDVPILRVNVSFKALLMEGHESGLLAVAIPFVCKVLEQCAKSTVFQPPNPWLMGIIKVLAELYRVADLKLNLKFEIEVLCKALKVDFASISPSNLLLSNAQEAANALAQDLARADMLGKTPEAPQPMAAVGATAAASGAIRMATPGTYMHIITLTSDDITVDIFSVLAQHTQFAETSEIFQTHPALKNKYFLVVGKAIRSIIPAHISRSVTVAVCCTRDTIVKDFCGDSDEEQMHRCAQIMARSMAGAMAVVLARDALKNALLREIFELLVANGMKEPIAEQASCALVASNLDLACAIAEKEAVERASVKIDEVLAPSYHSRKRTREHTGQPFYDMATYGRLMYPADFPDILKIKLSSLPPGVLRVYEDYAQIPHFLSQIVANPTGLAALGDGLRKGMYTPADRWSLQQCLSDFSQLMADLDKLVNTISDSVSFNTLPPSHEVFSYAREIVNLALQSLDPEALARDFAQALIQYLYRTKIRLGHELYVRLLLRMCKVSFNVEKEVKYWLIYVEDERKYNEAVTVALIKEGLVPLPEEDMQLARLIDAGRVSAILFAVRLIPRVLRERSLEKSVQDFSNTIAALNRAAQRAPVIPELVRFLKNLAAGTMTVEEEPVDQSVQDTRAALATASTAMSPLPDTPEVAGYRQVLLDWTRVCEHPAAGEKERTMLALQLLSQVNLSDSDTMCTFFMVCVDTAIEFYEKAIAQELHSSCHQVTDAVTKLLIYLLRYDIAAQSTDTTNSDAQAVATKRKPESQKTLLAIYLCLATLLLARDHAVHTATFPSRQNAYFRIFGAYLFEFHRAYKAGELSSAVYYHALLVFAQALDMIQPLGTPGFSYAWLALLSHRHFFPKLLTSKEGWPLAEKLVVAQLRFLEPFIYLNDITEAVRFMYGYTVRFLLITLHDFPEFLADHAVALCNATPVTCVQLRNLFLSAYSRDTVLPDPVAVSREQKPMPPMDSPPMIATDYLSVIEKAGIVGPLNAYLDDGNTESVAEVTEHLINAFSSPQFAIKVGSTSAAPGAPQTTRVGPRYSMALINSVVVHLGACVSENHELVPEMRKLIYQLLTVLDAEGRYLVLTAIANQLRFPSSFTIIFSRELLWLFTNPPVDRICEQIIRVLVERVLANRPLPWGLLFTLSELVRDPAYDAWAQKLSEETPQIQEILNSVAERVKRPFSAGAPSVSAAA